jgi:hypothetical protein
MSEHPEYPHGVADSQGRPLDREGRVVRRKTVLDMSVDHVEKALLSRAKSIGEEHAAQSGSVMSAIHMAIAEEFAALAEELHHT